MDDAELIEAAVAGEEYAGVLLVSIYAPMLMGYVRYVAIDLGEVACEEICARAVEKAVRKIDLYDAERGDFGTWARSMVRYEVLDHRRRVAQIDDGARLDELLEKPPVPRVDLPQVELAFSRLSEADQAVLALRDIEGIPSKAVAESLGISDVAVRQRHIRARRRLGALLLSHVESAQIGEGESEL